jgi:hypothetical protein
LPETGGSGRLAAPRKLSERVTGSSRRYRDFPDPAVENAGVVDPYEKPIPFRKRKRKQDEPLVRPTARIIRAGTLVLNGEVTIRTLFPATDDRAA